MCQDLTGDELRVELRLIGEKIVGNKLQMQESLGAAKRKADLEEARTEESNKKPRTEKEGGEGRAAGGMPSDAALGQAVRVMLKAGSAQQHSPGHHLL